MNIAKFLMAFALLASYGYGALPVQAGGYQWGMKSQDKWGWSRQSNENGRREACRGSKQSYNTLVSMYNNKYRYSKSKQVRSAWKVDIEDARRDIMRWCGNY